MLSVGDSGRKSENIFFFIVCCNLVVLSPFLLSASVALFCSGGIASVRTDARERHVVLGTSYLLFELHEVFFVCNIMIAFFSC